MKHPISSPNCNAYVHVGITRKLGELLNRTDSVAPLN